jgi:hypothetical protein
MKRNPKPFSVEIKKSRVQGQRSDLPPRGLFAAALAEATKIFQEEPQAAAEPSAAPRILPSIVEPVWGGSEPIKIVRRKCSSGEANWGQMEPDPTVTASGDVKDTHVRVPKTADAVTLNDVTPVADVQPAQGESVKAKSRKPRMRASGVLEQEIAPELIPEMTVPSVVSSIAIQRRMTKRLAAAAQLPRHERWKGRLHPAAW